MCNAGSCSAASAYDVILEAVKSDALSSWDWDDNRAASAIYDALRDRGMLE